MKKVFSHLLSGMLSIAFISTAVSGWGQCKPTIKIDGEITSISQTDEFGLRLPLWMKASQTLAVGSSVSAISVLEFIENGNALEYSQVVIVTPDNSPATVPTGTVWKVESVVTNSNNSTYKSVTFTQSGTHAWLVPACAEQICVEVWGAGGGGGGGRNTSTYYASGGGGAGAFGSECFTVAPNTPYTVTVGAGGTGGTPGNPGAAGGNGGNSSVGSLILATGGLGGGGGTTSGVGAGGAGGTSTAASNIPGGNGKSGSGSATGGAGGNTGNGGSGGAAKTTNGAGNSGTSPGGGGSGTTGCNCSYSGGDGGNGKVVITW